MENKLYIKVKCSICRGDKPFSCPYCDALGESYIEASDRAILRIVKAKVPLEDVLRVLEVKDV
tara:strand:- start:400 stop:588 length:189 start_codon:yes stop_codon:yes gene_type:complete